MINVFFLVGEIKKINVSTPKARGDEPAKPESAVMLVQYGPQRVSSNGQVEFVNAVQIRVPNFKFPQLKAKLAVGKKVQIHGKLQGVLKAALDENGYFATELVAERVFIDGDDNAENKPA
jgi:hypothetical protein